MLNPLGLLALLALPAIAFLHLWRRRHRPQPVSALFLWELATGTPAAGRRRERLRTTASLWLELAAALALALALAGPRACRERSAVHAVWVVDGSASMAAVDAGPATGPATSVRARALELLDARLAELPRGSRVSIVETGSPPRLLAGPAVPVEAARARLDSWRPAAAHHDPRPALALALSLAGDGAVTFVTDAYDPDAVPPEVELVALGRPLANAAIAHATRHGADAIGGTDRDEVFVVVRAFAPAPLTTTLTITADGAPLERRELALVPAERHELSFEIPRAVEVLELALGPDALAIDDRAVLLPEPPRTLALATTLAADEARLVGLSSGRRSGGDESAIDRWLALVPRSVAAPSPELAHLVIGRGADTDAPLAPLAPVAPIAPVAWDLTFASLGDGRLDLIGPFLSEKRHPLLAGLTLEGVVWSLDPDLALDGAPLVSAGDRPILCETFERGRRRLVLNVDPERSSLWRSPDWPILLANWAEERRRELPGPERTNLAIGEPLVYRARTAEPRRLVGPLDAAADDRDDRDDRQTLELAARETLYVEGLRRPGVFSLREGERELCRYALSFQDAAESDLRARGSGQRPASRDRAQVAASSGWVEVLLVLAALACLVADWFVLGRAGRGGEGAAR